MQERHVQEAHSDGYFSASDAFAKYAEDESTDFVRVHESEGGLLTLWDRLHELRLEQALFDAELLPMNASSLSPIEAQIQLDIAERECLAARSTLTLKHNAILDALVVFPYIRSIHLNESITEANLSSLLSRRDALAIACANLTKCRNTLQQSIAQVKLENYKLNDDNKRHALQLQHVANAVSAEEMKIKNAERFRARLAEGKADLNALQQNIRILKNVTTAVVSASGVSWAQDDFLLSLVLNDEGHDSDDG